MIQPVIKDLTDKSTKYLEKLQDEVDIQDNFEKKTEKAQSLWKSKSGSTDGKKTFDEVVKTLKEMCVSVEVCNYCEQNEANDIEHIVPKSFFPEKAFCWENYILACKQCNSGYKLDKCYVIDDNDEVIIVNRKTEPTYKTHAFINPRLEDPSAFMMINMSTFKFDISYDKTKKEVNKAKKTIDILQLNDRDTLIHARKQAAKYFYTRLNKLVKILKANSIDDIEEILSPYDDCINKSLTIIEVKNQLKESIKKDIQTHQHPSVWFAIKKIESIANDKWVAIFEQLPELLTW